MKRVLVLAAAAAVLTACTSSTEGAGAAGSRISIATSQATTTPAVTGFPSSAQLPPPSSHAMNMTPASTPPPASAAPVDVTGTVTGNHYDITVRAFSKVTDCAAHAYGTPLVRALEQHPCRSATRRLLTLRAADGRTIEMSTIVVVCAFGGSADPYRYVGQLAKLEWAAHTGSMKDLLLEGTRVPSFPKRIPQDEAFSVQAQDSDVTIFDAWYSAGPTPVQAPQLTGLEADLMLTQITAP